MILIRQQSFAYKDGFLASSFSLSLFSHPQHPSSIENIYINYSYMYVQNIHIQKGKNCAGIDLGRLKKNLSF